MSVALQVFLFAVVVAFLLVIVNYLRKGKLTFQYSLIWFVLSFTLMVCILFPNVLIDASHIVGVEVASNFVFLVEGIFVLVLLISLTLIVSKQRKQIVRLTQCVAILEQRLRALEEQNR